MFASAASLSLGDWPYPDVNLDGREYLDYTRKAGQPQVLLYLLAGTALLLFAICLGLAYCERAGRTTGAALTIWLSMTAFTASGYVAGGLLGAITLVRQGFPSFGTTAADLNLTTFTWAVMNMTYLVAFPLLGITWCAIAAANRAHPLLPAALGGGSAVTVGLINFAALLSVFVPTGPWSPGSVYFFLLQGGSTFGWLAITGFVLVRSASPSHGANHPEGSSR